MIYWRWTTLGLFILLGKYVGHSTVQKIAPIMERGGTSAANQCAYPLAQENMHLVFSSSTHVEDVKTLCQHTAFVVHGSYFSHGP